jgi:hypothetical protein
MPEDLSLQKRSFFAKSRQWSNDRKIGSDSNEKV